MFPSHLRSLGIAALTAALLATWCATTAVAQPAERPPATTLSARATSVTVGPATVTLDPQVADVAKGTGFAFRLDVAARKKLRSVQARMRLLMPGGDLIYQRTFTKPSLDASSASFTFERSIADIGLDPAAYPFEIGVDVASSGETSRTSIPGTMYVYDKSRPKLPVTIVARISAQPLSDPRGNFVSDPARFTRARDDARLLADWVLTDPNAKLTLALSPVMLQEWVRIAGGYQLTNAEGSVDVPPTDPVPQVYAITLDALKRAVATGRLEIVSSGYGDPNLFELKGAELLDDIPRQYEVGRSTIIESLATTPTGGTAPPHGAPDEALTRLAQAGLGYVVVPSTQASRNGKRPSAGVYRAGDSPLKALVSDRIASRSFGASTTAEAMGVAFARYLDRSGTSPMPVAVTLGPGAANGLQLVTNAQQLARSPWVVLTTGSEAAGHKTKNRVSLKNRRPDKDAPREYWQRVAESRTWSEALNSALPPEMPDGARAVRQSMVAAGSAWAGLDGEWTPAASGLAYALSATESAHDILDKVGLTASRITLAGAKGTVPVTMTNGTDVKLRVVLIASPGQGVALAGPRRTEVELDPGDNFVEIPVSLERGFSSTLELRLMAGGAEIASQRVPLQTSYLDRLVIGGGVLLLLGGLLFFIIRRVRAAESEVPPEPEPAPEQLSLDIRLPSRERTGVDDDSVDPTDARAKSTDILHEDSTSD